MALHLLEVYLYFKSEKKKNEKLKIKKKLEANLVHQG